MQYFPIFSGDPTLLTYLTRTLQETSCTITEKDGRYYLSSSDIDTLKSSSTLKPDANGLRTALLLLDSKYNTLALPRKIELCVVGILILLNGCIKLKYKNVSGLTRNSLVTPSTTESGIPFETDDKGQTRYQATPNMAARLNLVAGNDFYQEADTKSPNLKDLWLLARHDEIVAEALSLLKKSSAKLISKKECTSSYSEGKLSQYTRK